MKKQIYLNLAITGNEPGTYTTKPVAIKKVFKLYGYKFFLAHDPKGGWYISEFETGLTIVAGNTMQEAQTQLYKKVVQTAEVYKCDPKELIAFSLASRNAPIINR